MIRRQLPAYSPLPLGALVRAAMPWRRGGEAALRRALRERFSVEDAVLCGSGTQALQLALQAARARAPQGEADLVALPSFTCYDVASAAVGANMRVVFYDLDPESLLPDMESLTQALECRPGAVVVAPLYGYQPDWDALRGVATRHDVMVVEDAAQSFGALWRGRGAGGIGDISTLSFGRGKGWTAVNGGALLGLDRDLAPLSIAPRSSASSVFDFGGTLLRGLAQWGFGRPMLYGAPSMMPGLSLGETVFHPPVLPHALGRVSMHLALETAGAADAEAAARLVRAGVLADGLSREAADRVRVPRSAPGSRAGVLRLPVLVAPHTRARVLAEGRALGVMSSYPRPLPELPQLESRIHREGTYPGADTLAAGLVTVPTHSLVRDADVDRILALFLGEDS